MTKLEKTILSLSPPKEKEKLKVVFVKIPESQHAKIKSLCKKHHTTIQKLLFLIFNDYLKRNKR